ncbi:MAG: UbiA family prenyltransferase [Carnobacterium sp.]|uniref:UbiA family prenyltransferase n=1 Tax=Carnobacterium sp. TaxID=48221 RepID=UPI002FCBA3BF
MDTIKAKFKVLWELGEIYTSPLNLFLILLGVSFSTYHYNHTWNWRIILYVLTILFFHVAVNIFNNYMDYKNASDAHDYKVKSNIIGRENLNLATVKKAFLFFLALASFFGLLLVWSTNLVLLGLGVLGFYVGLFYSSGTKPLNSLPITETVTSLFSGFVIPLIGAYLCLYDQVDFSFHTIKLVFFISLPMVVMMFNNLLANNTCDLEEDIVNGRKTLVYYLGKKKAVQLFKVVFVFNFLWLILLVCLKLAPFPILLLVLLFPKYWKSLSPYFEVQDKQKTFPVALKNMAAIMMLYPILYTIGVVFAQF